MLVWCTDSVDNSAAFAAQALDASLTKETFADPNSDLEMVDMLKDPTTKILFYGLVKMPEWFEAIFDANRMYNDPRKCRVFLNRPSSLGLISELGVSSRKYITVQDRSWTRVREILHTGNVDLCKANTTLVANVSNSSEYNHHVSNGQVKYACVHFDPVGKYRVFAGVDHLTDGGVICVTSSVKRQLSYKETLMHGQSSDFKAALESLFEDGLIEEDPGKSMEAWTEETTSALSEIDATAINPAWLKDAASKIISQFGVDFCAIDVIKTNDLAFVTNVTSCPSIQETDVLSHVASYLSDLLNLGREITKEKVVEIISNFSEDEVSEITKFLKGMGKLSVS